MNKKQKIVTFVMLALIVILSVVMALMLVFEYRSTGTVAKASITRAVIIAVSMLLATVKIALQPRTKRKNVALPYRDHFAEVIGNAFSSDEKLEKRLFSAIDAYRSYNFAKAIKILNSLFPYAKTTDERFCILFFSAKCYYHGRYYDTAVKLYEKAFELKESGSVASNLTLCYDMLGDGDSAIEWGKNAISLEPESAYAYNNMASVLMTKGEYQAALEYLTKAVSLKINFEEALCNAAICYAMTNDRANYEKHLTLAAQQGVSKEEVINYLVSLDAPVLNNDGE